MAAKAHNEKRKLHCATPYTIDVAMAKELQKMLNAKQAKTIPDKRPAAYKKCLENFYEAPAGTTEKEVMDKNLATD